MSLTADLAQFYPGVSLDDVWTGRVSARRMLALIEHLALIPHSRVRMIEFGGDIRYLGWDINTDLAADRYDQFASLAAGLGGRTLSDAARYPRPGSSSDEKAGGHLFAESVDDFDVDKFMSVIAGR